MKYVSIIILTLCLISVELLGQCSLVVTYTTNHKTSRETLKEKPYPKLASIDGVNYAVEIPRDQDSLYLKLFHSKECAFGELNFIVAELIGGELFSNEGTNLGPIDKSDLITFTKYRTLKLAINPEEAVTILSFTSKVDDYPDFTIKISKPIDDLEVRINGKGIEPGESYTLPDTITTGDQLDLNIELFLSDSLNSSCEITHVGDFKGLLPADTSWTTNVKKFPHRFTLRLLAKNADTAQHTGYLTLVNDCFLVNQDLLEIKFKYSVAEGKMGAEEIFESAFWFFVAFLAVMVVVVIQWLFRYSRKKYAIRSLVKYQQDPGEIPEDLRGQYNFLEIAIIQSFKEQLLSFDSKKEVEDENRSRRNMLQEVIKSLQKKFFNQLYREEELDYISLLEIKKLGKKLGDNPNGEADESQTIPEIFEAGPDALKGIKLGKMKRKTLENKYKRQLALNQKQKEQFEDKLKQRIKEKEESFREERNKHLRDLKKKEDVLAEQRKVVQKMKVQYQEVAPYSAAMERYFDLTRDIYDFALNQTKQLSSSSIFYPFFDTILYVKGQAKAINPIFNQVTKDDFLCQVLKVDNRQKLADVDAQTFFEYYIKGRGFSMLNAIGKLYTYNNLSTNSIPLREQMIKDGIDLEYLGQVYQEINEVLAQEFGVRLYLPHLLKDKFDPDQYDKNNFSYLAKTYNFSGLEDYIIYDVERVGFKSTNGEQRLILRAMVTYKIS